MFDKFRTYSAVLALIAWPMLALADCADVTSRLTELQSLVQTRHAAQDALVMVRRSAQDFKNVLLRGSDPVQAQMLRQRFERNAQSYEHQLTMLQAQLLAVPSERERAHLLSQERVTLFEGYRQALHTHDVRRIEEALAADKAVQGADVKTFRALETIIENLNTRCEASFQALRDVLQSCLS